MSTELVPASEATDIETMKRADLPAIWSGYRAQLEKLKATAETLVVTDAAQKAEMKLARVTRLTLKDLRVEIEHRRKELGEEALRRKQNIDSAAKELRDIIEPLETRLLEQEQFAERKAAEEKAARLAHRVELLTPFGVELSAFNLNEMEDVTFAELLWQTELAYDAKKEAAAKAEAERIANEKAKAAEHKRISEENAKLKKEAEAREAKAKKEREEAAALLAKERSEAEAKAKSERDKAAEVARVAEEKARKEREVIEAKAKAETAAAEAKAHKEREAREKAEAELKAKRDAEDKSRKDAEAAARKAARAPDKEKLIAFRQKIIALEIPVMATDEGKDAHAELIYRISELQEWIETTSCSL